MSTYPSEPAPSPYLVPFDGSFRVADTATAPTGKRSKKRDEAGLEDATRELYRLQRKLYADDRYALLLVFQAMDAAGKDGTIRAVMTGVNPAGCQVSSFGPPSAEELDHDFLWRAARRLPERGRIGIFNRSHYEETLVVRVHPEFLDSQKLPGPLDMTRLWRRRFRSIRDFERHAARNGTVILKFWLNVSRDEQLRRFVDRIDEPESNWKFKKRDVEERAHWDAYMQAYEDALNATSRKWAPWYSIPADDKPYMRRTIADIVVATLAGIDLRYPSVSDDTRAEMLALRKQLVGKDRR